MSQETQDLVSWPRDLCGKLRLACEGTDSPTGVYPPLDRADLPRWVWCVLTWTLAAATLLGVFFSDFAPLTFFVVLPLLWWVYTKWWAAVVAHLVFAAGFAAVGYIKGDETWWINPLIMVIVVLVTGTWVTWVHIVRYEAIHALADKEEALAALARTQSELVAAEFLDELARLGRGRRMVICNVTDSSPFGWTRRFAAGLAERWRHLLVGTEPAVWKGRRFGNLLLAASGTRVDVTGLRRDSAKQPCPYRWIEGRELRSWIGGAEPFTDADMQDSPPPSGSKLWFS